MTIPSNNWRPARNNNSLHTSYTLFFLFKKNLPPLVKQATISFDDVKEGSFFCVTLRWKARHRKRGSNIMMILTSPWLISDSQVETCTQRWRPFLIDSDRLVKWFPPSSSLFLSLLLFTNRSPKLELLVCKSPDYHHLLDWCCTCCTSRAIGGHDISSFALFSSPPAVIFKMKECASHSPTLTRFSCRISRRTGIRVSQSGRGKLKQDFGSTFL